MTDDAGRESHYTVICVHRDTDALAVLAQGVQEICGSKIDVRTCCDAEEALALVDQLSAANVRVPLVIADHELDGMSGGDWLLALHERSGFRATRKVLTFAHADMPELSRVLNRGALHRILPKIHSPDELTECVRTLLTSFFVHHAPWEVDRFADLLDSEQVPRAFTAARREKQTLDLQMKTLQRSFLGTMDLSDEQVEQVTVAAIDAALDSPPRLNIPAGAVVLQQDEPVDTIFILLSGKVQLSRSSHGNDVILHTSSAGRIIGILSLAHRGKAFYSCRADTDVTVLPLTVQQLDTALQADPLLSGYFATALIRSMARRSMRTAELKIEVENLNQHLEAERDQLTEALRQLQNAQMRLVESEKMATLGQLSAGIAHELNNPVAAIRRAADFLAEDIVSLVTGLPDGKAISDTLQSALASEPLSTHELRARRTALGAVVGDEDLTRRLVNVGITTPEAYHQRFARTSARKRRQLLNDVERYHELGIALRNIRTCSDRIAGVVEGMRSYARSDQEIVSGVDLHVGLEDTLRLLHHELKNITVERAYGELPTIECRVGQINQVWTNLISNAAHAMGGSGTLRIVTDVSETDTVRARICNDGDEIAPDHLAKIFDPQFTTKKGRVTFGLGMGLAICQQIVVRHGGTISVESNPSETCFSVVLPIRCPNTSEDEATS